MKIDFLERYLHIQLRMLKRFTPLILALVFIGQACLSNISAAVSTKNNFKTGIHAEKNQLLVGQMDPAENEELDDDQFIHLSPVIISFVSNPFQQIIAKPVFVFDDRPVTLFRQPSRESICIYII